MSGESYVNIRQILGEIIGTTIVDITQHDEEEFRATHESYVALHLSTGATLTFPISDAGFHLETPGEDEPDQSSTGGDGVCR